jgi:hypothetical protein
MIAFDHGALQHRGEPLLAGILAHAVLEVSDVRVVTFLAHAEQLTVNKWTEILASARELREQARWHTAAYLPRSIRVTTAPCVL